MVNRNFKNYSYDMHNQTEMPGRCFPIEVHNMIRFRYDLVTSLSKNKKVLEVGCGAGFGVEQIRKCAKSYVVGEYSLENIWLIKRIYQNFNNIIQLDAHKLPFVDDSFDLIFAMAVVYYLSFKDFLFEAKRVLRKDGSFVFCTSNKNIFGFVKPPYVVKYHTIPELTEILNRAGFSVEYYGGFPMSGNIFYQYIRAILKNAAKKMIDFIPGGSRYWAGVRRRSLGKCLPLPLGASDMLKGDPQLKRLCPEKINRRYRIIYAKCMLGG